MSLYAPTLAVSRLDGQLQGGADGFFHGDRRALSRLTVSVAGVGLAPVHATTESADRAAFRAVLRGLGEHSPDPAVTLDRRRRVEPARLSETLTIANDGRHRVHLRLIVHAATDLSLMDRVKAGKPGPTLPAAMDHAGLSWKSDTAQVRLVSSPPPTAIDPRQGSFHFDVQLAPGSRWETLLECTLEDSEDDQFPPPDEAITWWSAARLRSADRTLNHWLHRSTADLQRLLLTDPHAPSDKFLAAGAPWFLTLFGRDSLWAARMLLPLGTELAAGTLRVLARRQGTTVVPATGEQPGKILHEVRRSVQTYLDSVVLPPHYFGTVDATALWLVLLHDAWRWGLAPEQVHALLPHAEAALAWIVDHGADDDGFVKYIDSSGRGLGNQGWKDSGDSIRFRDGRLAQAPIALCEVQAYAYQAATGGAALLRAFDRPGADRWQEWADRLRERFRQDFWVEDEFGPYPAVALDRDNQPVDSVTSGFGHLLGTGLLDAAESALLAARLSAPDLDSGYGLRTLSSTCQGYNPLGYHTGSVWPHDTAIAIHGLVRSGHTAAARSLIAGLVDAAAAFDGRLPELYAGHGAATDVRPAPYPAACRPQAWAAAAPVLVLQSLLGLTADVPGGTLTVAPMFSEEYRPMTVTGLRLAGQPLELTLAADGACQVTAPPGIAVHIVDAHRA